MASLYQRILEEITKAPDQPLKTDDFPIIALGSKGLQVAPGLKDVFFPGARPGPEATRAVTSLVQQVAGGEVFDWVEVERQLSGLPPLTMMDDVLAALSAEAVTSRVKRVFWDLARNSADYEMVKWGLGLATVRLAPSEVADLLVLARHPEFTLFAALALMREASQLPQLKAYLLDLLPVSRQWGVVRIIDFLAQDRQLTSSPDVQRRLVVHGMENCEGIPMEVAFTIAKAVSLPDLFDVAASDTRLFVALTDLMESLMNEPEPLGGLMELDNASEVFQRYVTLLRRRAPEVHLLYALHGASQFVANEPRLVVWTSALDLLDRELFAESLVRQGLEATDARRYKALVLVRDRSLRQLLPVVESVLESASYDRRLCIDILGLLGDSETWARMVALIPRWVDVEARLLEPMSSTNILGPGWNATDLYSGIVLHIGQLQTPEAMATLLHAAKDPHPWVRGAFCEALLSVKSPLPEALLHALRDRLADDSPYVARVAVEAATHHGI